MFREARPPLPARAATRCTIDQRDRRPLHLGFSAFIFLSLVRSRVEGMATRGETFDHTWRFYRGDVPGSWPCPAGRFPVDLGQMRCYGLKLAPGANNTTTRRPVPKPAATTTPVRCGTFVLWGLLATHGITSPAAGLASLLAVRIPLRVGSLGVGEGNQSTISALFRFVGRISAMIHGAS